MNDLYLVTGGLGHLGNTVVSSLLKSGNNVRIFALPGDNSLVLSQSGAQIFSGDIRNSATLEDFFTTDTPCNIIVIHTAGIVTIASKFSPTVYDVNVNGTKNIIEMCRRHKVKRLVYVSSVHAIPELPRGQTISEISCFNPNNVVGLYAKTKAEATQLVLDAAHDGLDAVVVHPSGILGPNDYGRGHITQLVVDYMNGGLKACVNGGYDFVDVRDVAAGVISAAKNGRAGECYILSNRFVAIPSLIEALHKLSGHHSIKVLPLWFARVTAPLSELYYKLKKETPLYTRYSLYTLATNANFSHQKATDELGYATRPMEQSLSDTILWLRNFCRIK